MENLLCARRGAPCWGHEENWGLCSGDLNLSPWWLPWLPWTPANLCCPCVGSELRAGERTLAHVVQNLLWPPPQGWCVGVGWALQGQWWQNREGWGKTLLSSFDSKDQDARTDGLSVTSPMPGRSCRQQVTGSSTGKQDQDKEVRLCVTFSR